MKVALVQCPGWGRECPPFALACLAAYVRRHGHEAACFDLNNAFFHQAPELRAMWEDKDYYSFWENRARVSALLERCSDVVDRGVAAILASGARVIGFTTHTTSYLVSLEVAKRLKRADPGVVVIFGGPQCSREQAGPGFAAEPCVDAVCVGEGEETLRAVLDAMDRDGALRPMPGLILRWEGRVRDCGDRELIAEIDSLPFPDYSDFREDILAGRYHNPRRLELFDSRGCVRTCHFCSEWQYWRRYRFMSGDRMFSEIEHQVKLYPQVDLFYFVGSLANGNMKALERFCDRMIESGLKVGWEAQAIVNPGMDERMLAKMAKAGCRWLGYGIETGSQALRARMNKRFTNENAYRTLQATHKAGIKAQINVMFGQPTETREEFQETLDFLRQVRPHVDSVLASQSFCVVDKGTIFHEKPELFGIRGEDHHLYWDSNEGENDYPERFRRYEEFCRLALSLGLPETSGVLARKPDKWLLLGQYYEHAGRKARAIRCYRRSLRLESVDQGALAALGRCYAELGRPERARAYLLAALELAPSGGDEGLAAEIRRALAALPPALTHRDPVDRLRGEAWFPRARRDAKEANVALNAAEYEAGAETMRSTPREITLGTHNACNAKCVFCLEGSYSRFNLELYKEFFEANMGRYLRGADSVTFTGFGEILWVPGIETFLDHINLTLPDTKKIFTTNGTPLKSPVLERLLETYHIIQISLHATTAALHKKLTLLDGEFEGILANIRELVKRRAEKRRRQGSLDGKTHPFVRLFSVLNTDNIDDTEAFVRLAYDLGVQQVRCFYMTIFAPEHIAMSCFFDQERANRALARARAAAEELIARDPDRHFEVDLPPLFGGSAPEKPGRCTDPWQYMYVELQGSSQPCCFWGEHIGNLKQGDTADGLWNGEFYRSLRRGMASGEPLPWCRSCVRYTGYNVNSLLAHVTNRPDTQRALLGEIEKRGLWSPARA